MREKERLSNILNNPYAGIPLETLKNQMEQIQKEILRREQEEKDQREMEQHKIKIYDAIAAAINDGYRIEINGYLENIIIYNETDVEITVSRPR
jgi:DNA-binding FadR family transcriptional regulator